jgi:hypothetical protein
MTGGTGHKGAISNSPSRPIEAILRLRIDTGARLETFGATKCMASGIAIGRAIPRRVLLVSRNDALRKYRKAWTIGAAEKEEKEGDRGCRRQGVQPALLDIQS